ncbi:hypothetical protein [Spirosoma montaniterrae]|uniref:Outer membrane protein beta-barrel domain-containing protein n=1 Tax=Spirosoma montaniterrae TaxID=1178516 RepID=A0A1P9WTF3_9BACT|nr:hypothetical protein [Spirosoma montaniterrae]AQG78613.1 hypothetical protein AWR27_04215 [Spirosoma montaniterrae]
MKRFLLAGGLLISLLGLSRTGLSQIRLDLEGGAVLGTAYNKIRIPNTGGTLVDLNELQAQPKAFYRIRLGYTLGGRHTISALYAPLTVRYEGSFSQPVNYNGIVFPTGQPITAFYQFNSYRLTYRYDLVVRERWRVGLGLTAKIRDANVRLRGETGGRDTNFDNFGFVPLINFYAHYRPTERLGLLLEGDALGSTQGRAEDIFGGITYQVSRRVGLKAGYRVVEGGANVESIYNFTWINYAAVGALIQF